MSTTSAQIEIAIDGQKALVVPGSTVAAALANLGLDPLRRSITGEPRGVLCAMGVCQECRVTIDGVAHRRACMTTVASGMAIERGLSGG